MYRVIIIDDEPWALVGIRKYIERGSSCFEVVYESTNPFEALEAIARIQPDLVFTDIRMPEISGLKLIERARRQGSEAAFVVISGYSEFAYAQQALREGALDYLLKPLDISMAREIMDKLQKRLDENNQNYYMRLYGMIHSDGDDMLKYIEPRLTKPAMPYWQAATLITRDNAASPIVLPASAQAVRMRLGPRKAMIAINSFDNDASLLPSAIENLKDTVLRCGMSPVFDDINLLSEMLCVSELAAFDGFVYAERSVFTYRPAKPSKTSEIWQRIAQELRLRHSAALELVLKEIPDAFRARHLTAIDALNLWNLIADNVREYLPDNDSLSDITPLNIHSLVEKFNSIESMCDYLAEQLSSCERDPNSSAGQRFVKLRRFVDSHYSEGLNLQELCEQFQINVSYCCELFRREAQTTFTQYIARLRMEHACELLSNSNFSIEQICERTGYNDYFYFNKVFKKNIGCTPAEYRRNNG